VTFTDIVTDLSRRLNTPSTEAQTRLGVAVNTLYKRLTASLGIDAETRRDVVSAQTDAAVYVTFDGIEKVISVANGDGELLEEVSQAALDGQIVTAASPTKYAIYRMGASSVVIQINAIPDTPATLTAVGYAQQGTLSGSMEPAFPESFHYILLEGVLAQELRKQEKPALADMARQEYDRGVGELRLFLVKSRHLQRRQGITPAGMTNAASGGGSVQGGTNYTQTGQITFDRDPLAPFVVTSGSAVVTNLDADKLDGQHGSYYQSASNLNAGTVPDARFPATLPAASGVNLTALNASNLGSGTIPDARFPAVIPASGIAFPSTQVPSANANTLDDYEEGTWTPTIGGSGGQSGQAYDVQEARYIKIGSLVWAAFRVSLSTVGTITGDVQIKGLPFTAETGVLTNYPGSLFWFGLASNWVHVNLRVLQNTTAAAVLGAAAAADSNVTPLTTSDLQVSSQFNGMIVYRGAA
jgi:hypothetical protein